MKNEVTISFHYLQKVLESEEGDHQILPFSQEEFDRVFARLNDVKDLDFSKEENDQKLRYRHLVKIERLERGNQRTIAGTYKSTYWGHSFENEKFGKIGAQSLNYRPFYFILYLSVSGKIYIGSQYLSNFGGYSALKKTLLACLDSKKNVEARSFSRTAFFIENAEPKEVRVEYSRKADSITGANKFGKTGVIVFKNAHKSDEFKKDVRKHFFGAFKKSINEKKKFLADALRHDGLIDIDDDEIVDCKVVAKIGNGSKTIDLMGESGVATKFPVDCKLDSDGHPDFGDIWKVSVEILTEEILKYKENV